MRSRSAGAVAVSAVAVLLAGCGSSSNHAGSSESADGAVVRPPAINTVSLAAATRSVDQVTQLHALAVNAGRSGGIPAAQIPVSAKQIDVQLTAQVQECSALHPATTTPAGELVTALTGYEALAKQLSSWTSASGPLPAGYFTQLHTVDGTWTAAMKAVGAVAKTNLLADVAPLLMPTS